MKGTVTQEDTFHNEISSNKFRISHNVNYFDRGHDVKFLYMYMNNMDIWLSNHGVSNHDGFVRIMVTIEDFHYIYNIHYIYMYIHITHTQNTHAFILGKQMLFKVVCLHNNRKLN